MRKLALAGCLLLACVGDDAKHKAAGNILFHNGDLAGAVREYRAAIAAAPSDGNGYTLLGNALFEQGDVAGARKAYEDALARDGKAREARRGLATVKLRQGDAAGARADFEALIAQTPNDPEAHAALGKLLLSQNELAAAESHLRQALASAQNDPGALYCLGLTLAKKKERAQALEVFDRLEAVTPGQAYAPYGRAIVAALDGKSDEALAWLGKALERNIEDLDGVATDPAFAPLKGDARFQALLDGARTRAGPKKGAR